LASEDGVAREDGGGGRDSEEAPKMLEMRGEGRVKEVGGES